MDVLTPAPVSSLPRSPVPLLDVTRDIEPLSREIEAALAQVIASGQFVHGPECGNLETQLADRIGSQHAIGCASGSDALLLSLMALDIGPGDEVLLPSFTFFATASAVTRLGARPVFVDIQPETFTMDVGHLESLIVPRSRAVIPVHLFGQCVDMSRLSPIADRENLVVIEDCAQAIDATHFDHPAGSLGRTGCFSFYPTKNLGGMGDGGMVTTSDAALAERLRLCRSHGMHPRYHHSFVGVNSRLDTMQAAVLLTKLPHLSRWTQQRQSHAARYCRLFQDWDLSEHVTLPVAAEGAGHVWNQFTIRIRDGRRDALRAHLTEQGIGTEIYYPHPHASPTLFRRVRV